MLGLIGKKVGMMQRFDANGTSIPVTVLETGPCTVVQVRSPENDGYSAVQLGFGSRKPSRLGKARVGHARKAGRDDFAQLKEFHVEPGESFEVGQEVAAADVFSAGDTIDVTGTSKGRGFAGVMKRYNFAGQSATHGTHESFRGPGAVGACAYPGRVFKGKKMPGRMGGMKTTVQNLVVVEVLPEQNLVLVRGAVPGARNASVIIQPAVKRPRRGRDAAAA